MKNIIKEAQNLVRLLKSYIKQKWKNISASFAKGLNVVAKRYTDKTLISMPQSDIYSNVLLASILT